MENKQGIAIKRTISLFDLKDDEENPGFNFGISETGIRISVFGVKPEIDLSTEIGDMKNTLEMFRNHIVPNCTEDQQYKELEFLANKFENVIRLKLNL